MAIVEKWEYKIIKNPFTPSKTMDLYKSVLNNNKMIENAESTLNKLGAEGWEFMPEGIPPLFVGSAQGMDHFGAWRRKVAP
jgi:hypothetical protein